MDWSAEVVISNACAAHNELERVKGYSPYQWTMGLSRPLWDPGDDSLQNRASVPNADDAAADLNYRSQAAKTYLR
eukprot:10142941-Alexandrium_andersonii.AAC.1